MKLTAGLFAAMILLLSGCGKKYIVQGGQVTPKLTVGFGTGEMNFSCAMKEALRMHDQFGYDVEICESLNGRTKYPPVFKLDAPK